MAKLPTPEASSAGDALEKLFSGDVTGFDAAMQEHLQGPAGTDMRLAHLHEQIAHRLFAGDINKAARLVEMPIAALGGRTVREAAASHAGMIAAKGAIAQLEALGIGAASLAHCEIAHRHWQSEMDLLLDLLPAAWGMSDSEFERLLRCPPGWIRAWRNHEVFVEPNVSERAARLRRLHNAFRLVVGEEGYAEAWRRPWSPDSPIGNRSPWQAYVEQGDLALDTLEAYFRAQP